MRALASFIMGGRLRAAGSAAVAAMLSLLLPPFSLISGAAVALVTLRRGSRDGALVMLLATLLLGGMTLALAGRPEAGLTFALVLWLPLWLLAQVLRRTVSLAAALEVALLLAGLVVIGAYLVANDPAAWWRQVLPEFFRLLGGGEQPLAADQVELLATTARYMTGLLVMFATLSLGLSLLLGRWWQALLYNPGGFRQEFHRLRLPRRDAVAALVLFLAASWGDGTAGELAANLALQLVGLYFIQGVAVAHGVVAGLKASQGWLALVYVLLLLALPQALVALSALGYADSWVDFRSRVAGRAGSE